VAVPQAGSTPKPLLIATHGAGDTPAWQCQLWQQLIGARGFVLCPAGVPFSRSRNSGYFYRNHHLLEREVLAAVKALRTAYAGRVDTEAAVYTGYSQGATMGALMVVNHAAEFSRLVLIEGGHHEWNVTVAKKYKRGGGQRVLFACGVRYCKRGADKSAGYLDTAGVPARVEYVEGAGHIYDGPVAERVLASFEWLVEGDPRWD
jgi:predicted esterase